MNVAHSALVDKSTMFTSIVYEAWFDKNVCESDG